MDEKFQGKNPSFSKVLETLRMIGQRNIMTLPGMNWSPNLNPSLYWLIHPESFSLLLRIKVKVAWQLSVLFLMEISSEMWTISPESIIFVQWGLKFLELKSDRPERHIWSLLDYKYIWNFSCIMEKVYACFDFDPMVTSCTSWTIFQNELRYYLFRDSNR